MTAVATLRPAPIGAELQTAKMALNRLLRLKPTFSVNHAGSPLRPDLEAYIRQQFERTYGARVTGFLPVLPSMQCGDRISAVAGIRPAQGNDLFVERYLDEPVEKILSRRAQIDVSRRHLVEIGNLSATHRGATLLFFIVQIAMLHEAGVKWNVFAATGQVKKIISKLHFVTLDLGPADPERLGAEAAEWGRYYDTGPTVLATNIEATMTRLRHSPLPAAVLALFRETIDELAPLLRL